MLLAAAASASAKFGLSLRPLSWPLAMSRGKSRICIKNEKILLLLLRLRVSFYYLYGNSVTRKLFLGARTEHERHWTTRGDK